MPETDENSFISRTFSSPRVVFDEGIATPFGELLARYVRVLAAGSQESIDGVLLGSAGDHAALGDPEKVAVEREDRLGDAAVRHHFLCRIYAFSELRELGENPSRAALTDFQRRHKHVLMTYDQHKMRALGKIAADADSTSAQTAYRNYAETFRQALSEMPTHQAWANSVEHMYGHFKQKLPAAEKAEFLAMLAKYRAHKLELEALLARVRAWCGRYEYDYFADQTLFEPYPRELAGPAAAGGASS